MVYVPKQNPRGLKIPKKNKYGAKKCDYMGQRFDSIIERDRFIYLQDAQKRGEIRNLRCQVPFSIDIEGAHICKYIADFCYETPKRGTSPVVGAYEGWYSVVEDVKGMTTAMFKIKAKLLLATHGIEIKVVKSSTLPI